MTWEQLTEAYGSGDITGEEFIEQAAFISTQRFVEAQMIVDDVHEHIKANCDKIADHIDGYDRDDLGESPDY